MTRKKQLFLFHGNDSHASLAELGRWQERFREKYGTNNRRVIEADELTEEFVLKQVSLAFSVRSLFPEPSFIIIKQLSSQSASTIQTVLQKATELLASANEDTTLVLWENKTLSDRTAIFKWFLDKGERVEVKQFVTPQARPLIASFVSQLSPGQSLSPDAVRWLEGEYRRMEKAQRIEARLRATDSLTSDTRSWFLGQLVLQASLLLPENTAISPEVLEKVRGDLADPVHVFEIVNAVGEGNWASARALSESWKLSSEDNYFSLYSLLRNQARRDLGNPTRKARSERLLRALAEMEIIIKNVALEHAWLLDRLWVHMSDDSHSLFNEKRLWLSHLQRVG